jgi:NADH-quinone oxidoreductase subunit M
MGFLPPHIELLCLLALPLVAGIIVFALGPNRGELIRWISTISAFAVLLMAGSLSLQFMALDAKERAARAQGLRSGPTRAEAQDLSRRPNVHPTFRPVFVPGSPGQVSDEQGRLHEDAHATSWNLLPIGEGAVQFYIGLDGLNVWLVMLTAALTPPAVLVSWTYIKERVNEFYAWLLILQTAMMGIFMSFDIVLFYVFFELSLIPLFFLIGIWGGPERRHAAGKFFIYTLTGSLITLLGVIALVLACQTRNNGQVTFSIPQLVQLVHTGPIIDTTLQFWVFLALMAGFAIKVPLVPFHTWLPLAHVEAPTAGSVDLAGVLLKVGAYGFLRLCVPLAPDTSLTLGLPLVSTLAVIGIVYGSLCAYAQEDIKRLVAYSSVSHLGLCMLGMFALNSAGVSGSIMQMINHGLSTGGLFLLVGMLYERYHTRLMGDFGGMSTRLPLLGAAMVFICLTSVGLPGLNGFIGEALCLFGVFQQELVHNETPIYGIIGALGMFLGAWYLLTMVQRVFFGTLKEPPLPSHDKHHPIGDLNFREVLTIVPVFVFCVAIGVYPQPVLDAMRPDVGVIEAIADRARERQEHPPTPTVAAHEEGKP